MIIEYVATFPNVTVNAGDEYNTCVLPMKTLKLMCVDGTNSPGKRPEVVDLNLNSTTQSTESLTSRPAFVPNSSPEDDQSSTPKKMIKMIAKMIKMINKRPVVYFSKKYHIINVILHIKYLTLISHLLTSNKRGNDKPALVHGI